MKKLTVKQEKFAQLVVKLGNQSEAYRQAYNVSETTSIETIKAKASRLAAQYNISTTIERLTEELNQELKQENKIDRQWVINHHKEVIDWYIELKELAKRKDLSKEEKSRVYMLKDLIKGSDYRGSLDSITKILGLNAPDKVETKDTSHKTDWGS